MKYLKYCLTTLLFILLLSPAIVFIGSVFWYIMTGTWLLVGVSIIQYAAGTLWCMVSVAIAGVSTFGTETMIEDY